jgi:hypothetical protein
MLSEHPNTKARSRPQLPESARLEIREVDRTPDFTVKNALFLLKKEWW